ncbi:MULTISPECIES: pyrroline-5-carboxylate reductase [unclassified Meridianimarinicoccus]|uniref:pyrroline-5-carboxylate reductase n=1 Tax=unclassified Meridianimarinicoccus TaxID=2923344 RepID=UPI0018679B64|nr:pyrroline-5-carboxylate reductase [Fluviibacterium sp. MJW13]
MMNSISGRGLVMLGCGKMGSALLQGWLDNGLDPAEVWVRDPHPAPVLGDMGVTHVNDALPANPAVVIVAVKPQLMNDALPDLAGLGNGDTMFLSVAAGVPISSYEQALGPTTPIVRAMPNTPAAIGQGITAIIGNGVVTPAQLDLAETLLSAVGQVVRLEAEAQLDAVTGVSGSGPAYVFHMIEALAAAGEAEGLPRDLSVQLATATVAGAGALAMASDDSAATLRENVTSPNGTTAAGLAVLMSETDGLPPLIRATVAAAANRSRELGK